MHCCWGGMGWVGVSVTEVCYKRHFAPKRVGVRGPRGEFSPQPKYPRGEF